MLLVIRFVGLVAVVAGIAGCGGGSTAPTTPNSMPNASEMFDKKEMPRGAKQGGKADPG
jgi:hypothetical protein